jgi:hypothetical protein
MERCHGGGAQLHHEECCLGDCAYTRGEVNCDFQVALQVKHATDGHVEKYKAKFVAHGFSQREGVDYEETFAPVAIYSSI